MRGVTVGGSNIEINLQRIFNDSDLSWGDHLLYQSSRADIDLVSMEGAFALTDQGSTAESKAEKILTNNGNF